MHDKKKKLQFRKFIIGLGCAAPLLGSYYIIPRYTLPFDFYDHYFIFIIIHLYNIFSDTRKSDSILPTWLIKGFSILLLSTIFSFFDNPNALNFTFAKQFLGAIFSASSYYIIFKLADFNLFYLFKKYANFAFYASALAILEEILHLTGNHIRPVFSGALGLYRVGGLSGEPYNLSMALFPAMFFYLTNIMSGKNYSDENRKWFLIKSVTIFTAFFLTFSSTGYIGLFMALFVIAIYKGYFNIRRARIILAPIFFIGIYFMFDYLTSSNKNFNSKVEDGIWFLQGDEKRSTELDRVTTSSFALLSNYYITLEGFKENPIAGIGLGNYETLYNQKFSSLFGQKFEIMYGRANFNDANSMFLRLLAETGIIGVSLFLSFILWVLIKKTYNSNKVDFYLIVINHGIFILFLIRLLRCGNYLSDGMFFFILLYFYSSKLFKSLHKERNYLNNALKKGNNQAIPTSVPHLQ